MDGSDGGETLARIIVYAEHLHNIRTLSIQASLATVSNKETRATLSVDGNCLTLQHEGESATIRLPVSIGRHNDATLTVPAAPTKDLTFRLSIEEKPTPNGFLGNGVPGDDNIIPWMASDLTSDTEVSCANCQTVFVKRGRIEQWKDLPSEGWAEMMDFWHCHKPDVPEQHSHDAENVGRGFAANSKLVVQSGVGLVGPTDFLLATEDCTQLKTHTVSKHNASRNSLLCSMCRTCIGIFEAGAEGYKLRKPCLSISPGPASPSVHYSYEKWLSSALLTAAESQGVRRLAVYAEGEKAGIGEHISHVWLFAPDVTILSSAAETADPMRVVKILYRNGVPADVAKLGGVGIAEGEVELSVVEWCELRDLLDKSAGLLPEKARAFQNWNVGLLGRFTIDDMRPRDGR